MFRSMDSELRIAMMQAMEERQELGHEFFGPDHLLLGLLSNVRGTAYEVLTEHGVTYDGARRVVVDKHDDTAAEVDTDLDDESTATSLDEDREALRAIGIDLDKVRDAVRETFGEDITARWGQRRERGRGRRPGGRRGGRGHHRHTRADGRGRPDMGPFGEGFGPGGRGRRGPRSRRLNNMSPAMRAVMHRLRQDAVRGVGEDVRPGERLQAPFTAGAVLAALVDSGDPVVAAIIEAADDPTALHDAIDVLAGRVTS